MRTIAGVLGMLLLACGTQPGSPDAVEKPCGCDAKAEAEGRLCPRLTPAEVEAFRGEVGPDWENCPPLPTTAD
jgi:hypothetical protein